MVAKSYQSLEQIGDPFVSNGKKYVYVKTKSGANKPVRWYTSEEYSKMYGEKSAVPDTPDRSAKTQKEALGFERGYITIFKGDTYSQLDWFRASNARYAKWWGWYVISTEALPFDLPVGIEPLELPWDLVGNEDGSLKNESVVKTAVDSLIFEPGTSEYVGEVGERLELDLTVLRAISMESHWGHSTMHIMEDACGNIFAWTTSAKTWPAGSQHHIRGTVKAHQMYRNTAQTILTRCSEI